MYEELEKRLFTMKIMIDQLHDNFRRSQFDQFYFAEFANQKIVWRSQFEQFNFVEFPNQEIVDLTFTIWAI